MEFEDFRALPLWQQMVGKNSPDDWGRFEFHLRLILPEMEHYVDTFPTYTLHNRQHVYNVIRIMGRLLGDQIDRISGLEAAILVLSAAYHDYGMVFSGEEKAHISGYVDFRNVFLAQYTSARLQFETNEEVVSDELAEWYCRWAHAERVWKKLELTEAALGPLTWDGMPIKDAVGNVCASHNEAAENIRVDDERFKPDFMGKAI